jgi:hypothetical protein
MIPESASDMEVIKMIEALIEFSFQGSLQKHSDIMMKYLNIALESYFKCNYIFSP